MKFDSKVKGGLAWAGLFVILAVPSADLLFGKDKTSATSLTVTSDTAQVKPALVVPAAKPELKADPVETASIDTPAAKSDDPVDTYIGKGKKLPAYISDADSAPAAVKPAVPVTVKQPVEVAAVSPVQETPPVPLPRSARPVATAPVVAAIPAEQPLIIDETDLAQRQANLSQPEQPIEPFPLSDGDQAAASDDAVVSGDQLEEWDSGSLADYLAAKGLLNDDQAQPQDEGDLVFNEGPSRPRRPQNDFFLF